MPDPEVEQQPSSTGAMATVDVPSYAEERARLIQLVPPQMREFLETEFRFEFKGPVVLSEAVKERQRRKNLYDGGKEPALVDDAVDADPEESIEEED